MKRILTIAIAAAVLLLTACSSGLDRKLDGTSEQAFETSLAAMKKSAKPEEIKRLDDALMMLAVTDVSIGYEGGVVGALQKISNRSPEQLADVLMLIVNGRTGRDLVDAGQKRKKDEATKQAAKVDAELAQLKKLNAETVATQAALAPIEVQEATLRFNSVGPEKMSVMDFKIKNGTETGLSYLFLRGTVSEPATRNVLFSDDIKYKLADEPLLPGVTKSLRLPYSGRGKWNAPEIWGKDNLIFTMVVVNAENLQGQKLAASFTLKDAERLAALEKIKLSLDAMLASN